MSLRDLAPWLLTNQGFNEQMTLLTADMVCSELGPHFVRRGEMGAPSHDWRYLLLAASVLSVSSEGTCQAAALRIAQGCLSTPNTSNERQGAAALVLDCLANQPAIALAVQRGLLFSDFQTRLPAPARIEWMRRNIENSVPLGDDSFLPVNRFQKHFWGAIASNDWVSVSAPTSAGKSFIMTRWIREFIRSKPTATLVYLVPTRALISEVEKILTSLLQGDGLPPVNVSTLPLPRSLAPEIANVLVFTQERLHLLLTAMPALFVDALIVDEAHKVGDRQRGVLLQAVIEHVAQRNPHATVLFASPMTSNPEFLLSDAEATKRTAAYASDDVTVNQNLIWVSQVPRHPTQWEASLCMLDRVLPLGQLTLSAIPTPETKRLPFVAHAIGGHQNGNIIYVNGAAYAEKTATQLFDLIGPGGDVTNPELDQLIELTRKIVHEEFLLPKVLKRGIAFHYGNLPLLIRNEVERLFSIGTIRYLICTSTLVEGVNMSCRNIFLRGPQKGQGHPMSADDFWNLAGRAGRWGKEFQGNVVCVDASRTDIWGQDGPPKIKSRSQIRRTTDLVMSDSATLVQFIADGAPQATSRKKPEFEYVFSYLMAIFGRTGSVRNSAWAARYTDDQLGKLDAALREASDRVVTPVDIIERNPGISPFGMDALLKEFRDRSKPVEELLPAHPASDDAVLIYTRIFSFLARHTNPKLGPEGKRAFMLALLVTRWMRGFPLSRLISDRLKRAGEGASTATVIRSVMEDVEQVARFEAPKGLNCYRDLLQFHLRESGRPELIAEIPDVAILLEFGVSQQTQLALIGLGLSRTSAIALSEIIAADDLTAEKIMEWLRDNSSLWRESDMPALVKKEVEAVFLARGNRG
jgi:hypothetical protein